MAILWGRVHTHGMCTYLGLLQCPTHDNQQMVHTVRGDCGERDERNNTRIRAICHEDEIGLCTGYQSKSNLSGVPFANLCKASSKSKINTHYFTQSAVINIA